MTTTADPNLSPELQQRLAALIASDDVVLFMKGTRDAPRCGFSATVVEILDGLVADYQTVDVLADPAVREGIKRYSDWPTIPQLYVKGELLGGADIVQEMVASGELPQLLQGVKPPPAVDAVVPDAFEVTLTAAAARALAGARDAQPADARFLRIAVSPRFQHQLGFSKDKPGDLKVSSEGVDIVVDAASARRAQGLRIDAVTQPDGGVAFRIENPNEPPSVKMMTPQELKQRLDEAKAKGQALALFDVRTPGERAIAHIEGAQLLDDEGRAQLESLDHDVPLVFFCHHGGRSQAAAEHYLKAGYKTVYNVAGGIDAWAREVDPTVSRY